MSETKSKASFSLGEASASFSRQKAAETGIVYELPKTFSFSQIRAFETCPYQYKLAYLLHIPTKQSHYFSFGTTIHVTLQRFFEEIQTMNGSKQGSLFGTPAIPAHAGISHPSLDDLMRLYEECWIEDWYESKAQREAYYAKGKKLLRAFYERHDAEWSVPVALEKGFKMAVGKFTVTGKIDRVDRLPNGHIHIIDYKTGGTKETLQGSDKDQLLLYQLAALRVPHFRHIGSPELLTYYYLEDGVQTSFLGRDEDIAAFEEKMIATMENIMTTDWSSVGRKDACGRCEFCSASLVRT